MFGGPTADPTVGRLLLFAIVIVLMFADPRPRTSLATELTRPRCGPSPPPSIGCRRATCPPRSGWPARTSSRGWPTATTAWPRTSSDATASWAGSSRRSMRYHRAMTPAPSSTGTAVDAASAFALIDAVVVMGDPALVDEEEVVPGVSRPLRAEMRAGGTDIGVLHRTPAGDPTLGARRPGPARALRERDGRGHPQCAALRDGRGPEPPAPRAGRGQGRVPARGESQPADPADQHPGLCRPAGRGSPGSAAGDHRRTVRTAVPDGPPAPDRDATGIGRAQAAQRGRLARDARAQGMGGARRRRRRLRRRRRSRTAGWPSRIRISSTRSCGPSSTTRSSTVPARRSRSTSPSTRPPAGSRLTIADGGPGVAEADRDRLFARFARGSDPAVDGGSGLGLYVSRELCRAMGGELVLEPASPGRGATFTITLPGEPGDEG